ncbi:hypothetical protein [Thiomicrorhabdus arctica]|uniref:hypothetical protein n=1 Tax=Thiomicrorhabdus arctica TaxID=131540 RepID=UPI00035DAD6E|nr:hypothetical protein [Thiomicrorhabdus arctica]
MTFKLLILTFIVVLFSGCSAHIPKQGLLVENPYFSINWNSHDWSLNRDKNPSKVRLSPGVAGDTYGISADINYNQQYRSSYVNIRSQAYFDDRHPGQAFLPGSEMFFDQDADYTQVLKDERGIPAMMTKNHGGLWVLNPSWNKVVYIYGLKCLETTLISTSFRDQKTYCGYYDIHKGKRILQTRYDYMFNKGDYNEAQWQEAIKQPVPPSAQPLDAHLQDALSHLLSTLKIPNMDVVRMQKEGLLHNPPPYVLKQLKAQQNTANSPSNSR